MTAALLYDPPSGWKYGFPKRYWPLPDDSVADTLLRDGYPQFEIDKGGHKHCRFWVGDDGEESPTTAPGAVVTDCKTTTTITPGPRLDRYPAPTTADLVTLWKRGQQAVLSITADGKVHDFHLPPARLVYLLREVAEQLAESTILK